MQSFAVSDLHFIFNISQQTQVAPLLKHFSRRSAFCTTHNESGVKIHFATCSDHLSRPHRKRLLSINTKLHFQCLIIQIWNMTASQLRPAYASHDSLLTQIVRSQAALLCQLTRIWKTGLSICCPVMMPWKKKIFHNLVTNFTTMHLGNSLIFQLKWLLRYLLFKGDYRPPKQG